MTFGLKDWGKPLTLDHRHSAPPDGQRTIMFHVIALVARFLRPTDKALDASPAALLLQDADSRAGLDAHHAQELRAAASAWLSVVR